MVDKFNIRVYGIWIKEDKILVSNEDINGFKMMKLPGGGLEFGEGPKECVIREFNEELKVSINVQQLVHTTNNFIQSAFRKNEQVVAIHYRVSSLDQIVAMETKQITSFGNINYHHFEWRELNENLINEMTFEMDRQALLQL